MKAVLVIAFALLSFVCKAADTDSYRPVVEVGKTWWYSQYSRSWPRHNVEYGLTIGESTEIEGKEWYPVSTRMYLEEYDGDIIVNKDAITVAYVREEDGVLYSWLPDFDTWNFQPVRCYEEPRSVDCLREITMFDFKLAEGDEFQYHPGGYEDETYPAVVDSKSEIESVGSKFNTFKIKYYLDNDKKKLTAENGTSVEGVGSITDMFYYYMAPRCDCSGFDAFSDPLLRYVTDAEDNVVFEHYGGMKLWLEYNSVNAPECPNVESAVLHNLQGVQVAPESVSPGIYIRVSGDKAEKVVVK